MRWGVVAILVAVVGARGDADPHPSLRMRDIDLRLPAHAAEIPATGLAVFLDRKGEVAADGFHVTIPPFGGGDRVWNETVGCVRRHFAPFAVAITTVKPRTGNFIHVVFGGRASMKDLDDRTTNGVAPFNGDVLPGATAHVFSENGSGEKNSKNLCRVAAHEIGHTLGLDHTLLCGDLMSYCLSDAPRFMDSAASCGEDEARDCSYGGQTQSSYRRLVDRVGLRHEPAPEDPYDDRRAPIDPYR